MHIEIIDPNNLSSDLSGKTTVVVDVCAATTNIAAFIHSGVSELLLVNKNNILQMHEIYKDAFVVGESKDPEIFRILDGLNSPSFLIRNNIFQKTKGKRVLYMTNNGTRVIMSLTDKKPERIITASFVNFSSVVSYLKNKIKTDIYIVPAGEINFQGGKAEDDLIFTEILKDKLCDVPIESKKVLKKLRIIIKKNYLPLYLRENMTREDMESDISIISKINYFPVVPLCFFGKTGLISIKNDI